MRCEQPRPSRYDFIVGRAQKKCNRHFRCVRRMPPLGRSSLAFEGDAFAGDKDGAGRGDLELLGIAALVDGDADAPARVHEKQRIADRDVRSEEHTSELQSHSDLVCRLLLEKKKKKERKYKK